MVRTQSDVGVLFDSRSEAIWMKDIERLMSLYSPDIVYFDLVPLSGTWDRLRCDGGFLDWFEGFEGPIGREISDLNVIESGDAAVAHAHPSRRNPEERARRRILGPCDRWLSTVERRVADHARTCLTAC